MKKRRFLINSLVLTANAILLSVLGMLFRLYQTRMIGAEGMGLMQLLFSVYFLGTNLASSGLNLAVTRLVSEARAGNAQVPVGGILRKCVGIGLLTGIFAGSLLFCLAEMLGAGWLGDIRTVNPLRILSLGLPFFSVSVCLRGYFLAVRKTAATAIGQILEQLCGFAVSVLLLPRLAPHGLSAACCGIAAGMTAGEILGNLFISVCCILDFRHERRIRNRQKSPSCREIFAISAPIALGYYLRSALGSVENVLIPTGLRQNGSKAEESLAQYGMVRGMVWPVLTLPSACLAALSSLLIPEVAEARAEQETRRIRTMAARVFEICLLFSCLVAGIFFWFGRKIGLLLYQSEEAGELIQLLCPLVPFLYLDSIVDAMLKGMNEQVYSLKVNLSDSCLRVLLILLLLPQIGMKGFLIATFFSGLYNSTLSIGRLMRKSKLRVSFVRWVIFPLGAVSVASLVVMRLCVLSGISGWGEILLAVGAGAVAVVGTRRILPEQRAKIT